MSEEYEDKVLTLEWLFTRLYTTWDDIEIDFNKEPPESLDRLERATEEFLEALIEFKNDAGV